MNWILSPALLSLHLVHQQGGVDDIGAPDVVHEEKHSHVDSGFIQLRGQVTLKIGIACIC